MNILKTTKLYTLNLYSISIISPKKVGGVHACWVPIKWFSDVKKFEKKPLGNLEMGTRSLKRWNQQWGNTPQFLLGNFPDCEETDPDSGGLLKLF